MNTETVLITGANRGIGLGLVEGYLKQGHCVIATCRDPNQADMLQSFIKYYPKTLKIEKLDVTHIENFRQITAKYEHETIDILINNAGIFPEAHSKLGIKHTDHTQVLAAFNTNAVGALIAIQSFQNNLLKSNNPRVINLSSQMGAISAANGFGYAYRMSKVALNMLTCSFAMENKRIITIALRPGWVKTPMGGVDANISVEESVNKMLTIIDNLEPIDSGGFFDNEKNHCSW